MPQETQRTEPIPPVASRHWLSRFCRDRSGAVAAWAAIAFPVLSIGAAISYDVSRLQALDHDLQSAADALSRAGAVELDQAPDSLIRANRAITTLVTNTMRANDVKRSDVTVESVRFLKRQPSPSWADVTPDMVTTNPSEALFVEVAITPTTVKSFFPTDFLGKFSSVTLDARSVAGLDIGVCGSAPIFVCNPFEGSGTSIYDAVKSDDFRRRQVTLIEAGTNATYAPGNFGWLDPFDDNSGAEVLRDEIAKTVSNVCVSKTLGVSLRPGKIASMSQGFNTKFDMYDGSFNRVANDPDYAPALNVIKGQANNGKCGFSGGNGNGSNGKKNDDTIALPVALGLGRDSGSDPIFGERFGNGDWDFYTYMVINHPGMSRVTLDGVTYRINTNSGKVTPSTPPSRYSVYRWEIDNNLIPGSSTYGNATVSAEEGAPICNTNTPPEGIDPRVLSVAIIDCATVQAAGYDMNGRTSGVPVSAFAKVFVTEPMGKSDDNIILGEIIGLVQPGGDPASRDRVAVVR